MPRRGENVAAFFLLQSARRWQHFRVGISLQQFERMKARLKGKPAAPLPTAPRSALVERTILGIDPSLRGTGYGIIRASRSQAAALAHGTIVLPQRLGPLALSRQNFASACGSCCSSTTRKFAWWKIFFRAKSEDGHRDGRGAGRGPWRRWAKAASRFLKLPRAR